MRSQAEIRRFAENKYRDFLERLITREKIFPLVVPFGRPSPTADLAELIDGVQELVSASTERDPRSYSVELELTRTRRHGSQRLPKTVFFRDEHSYVGYLGRENEVSAFKANLQITVDQCPALVPWVTANTSRMVEFANVWPKLIAIGTWFQKHPRPNCYAREIPVSVHTKFIEEHVRVLGPMLKELLPQDHDPLATDFHSRFYLKDKEALVRVRLPDEQVRGRCGIPLSHFAVPVSEFLTLPLSAVRIVVVVENEVSFLTLPSIPNAAFVWGSGNGVHLIADAPWLREGERALYWGDVDARGLTILGWLRRRLPKVRSILMDPETLAKHPHAEVDDPSESSPEIEKHLLTANEWDSYHQLVTKTPRRRLEQERIPTRDVLAAISNAEKEI